MRSFLIIAAFLVLSPLAVFSQSECSGVCISQAAANVAAQNARLIPTLEAKIAVLDAALIEKDKSIAEVKEAARLNEADLKEALKKTEIDLALKTGQIIQLEAEKVRMLAIIDFMLKNGRIKKYGLINLF